MGSFGDTRTSDTRSDGRTLYTSKIGGPEREIYCCIGEVYQCWVHISLVQWRQWCSIAYNLQHSSVCGKGHILQRHWWHNTAKGQTVNLPICSMLIRLDDDESFVGWFYWIYTIQQGRIGAITVCLIRIQDYKKLKLSTFLCCHGNILITWWFSW